MLSFSAQLNIEKVIKVETLIRFNRSGLQYGAKFSVNKLAIFCNSFAFMLLQRYLAHPDGKRSNLNQFIAFDVF